MQIALRVYGEKSSEYALILNNIAKGQVDSGSYDRAEKMLNEGIGILEKAVADKSVDVKWAASAIADALQNYQRLLQLTGRG